MNGSRSCLEHDCGSNLTFRLAKSLTDTDWRSLGFGNYKFTLDAVTVNSNYTVLRVERDFRLIDSPPLGGILPRRLTVRPRNFLNDASTAF